MTNGNHQSLVLAFLKGGCGSAMAWCKRQKQDYILADLDTTLAETTPRVIRKMFSCIRRCLDRAAEKKGPLTSKSTKPSRQKQRHPWAQHMKAMRTQRLGWGVGPEFLTEAYLRAIGQQLCGYCDDLKACHNHEQNSNIIKKSL